MNSNIEELKKVKQQVNEDIQVYKEIIVGTLRNTLYTQLDKLDKVINDNFKLSLAKGFNGFYIRLYYSYSPTLHIKEYDLLAHNELRISLQLAVHLYLNDICFFGLFFKRREKYKKVKIYELDKKVNDFYFYSMRKSFFSECIKENPIILDELRMYFEKKGFVCYCKRDSGDLLVKISVPSS
ncbi:hypothetical protein [Bacillus sp. FJAT-29937]|uniref:hypothetical protein n=1 Tax=Bacillus sp. FJAT-29937 TaxID=1720553 RepID=UPI00082F4C3A|nr:hypothetical protein [Bacillus sp. FJAT-29937]